ncbi:hypothetical protein P9112_001722 [Eukaryota sp. TZLM1-RC]
MPSLKTGYLEKKPYLHKRFRRRYFVLSYDELTYAKDPQSPLLGSISLTDALVRPYLDDSGKHSSVFTIKNPVRTVYIRATCDDNMMQWINAIRAAIESPSVDLIPMVNFSLFHNYFAPKNASRSNSPAVKASVSELLDSSEEEVDLEKLIDC